MMPMSCFGVAMPRLLFFSIIYEPVYSASAANPMKRSDVDAKCFDLMAPVLGKTRPRKLIDTVWDIEKVTDMRSLSPLLQAPRLLP